MKVSVSGIDSKITSSAARKASGSASDAQSFGRTSAAGKEAIKMLAKSTASLPKGLQWLGRNDGEILNSVVTGLGTAFVAPIFIAFNPFSKEDKETKLYSAWRQPISAVIAAVMQIGINMKYNKHLDKIASTGHFDRADLRHNPADSYLRSIIKLEQPDISKEKLIEEIKKRQEDAQWDEVNRLRESMKNEVIDPEKMVDKEAISAAKKQIKEQYKDKLSGMSKKQAEKFIAEKLPEQAKIAALEQVKEKTRVKFLIRSWAKKAQEKGMSFADLIKQKNQELEALRRNNTMIPARFSVFEQAVEKISAYKEYSEIKPIGETFKEIMQSVKIKKMVHASSERAKEVLAQYRRWTGIVISLVTLPISCGLLNYAYPRIMEKIMPNASKKKKQQQMGQQMQPQKDIVPPKGKEGIK
ncbi:MAG: hypothetical protein K6A44_04905 [bacterium]|nr:hypothetical protein [bacterium]